MRFVDLSLLFASAILGIFLAVYITRNRRAPGSQALSVLILGASLWSLGYALEIVANSLSYKLLWEKFEFLGIVVIPLAWFTFVAQYLGNPRWMTRILKHRFLLGVIPVVTIILVWTNDYHNLLWEKVELEPIGPLVTLDFVRGPWFWVLMVFSYLLLLMGSIKLAISLFSIVRLQRWQVLLTLLAILLPWLGNILYVTGWSPEHFLDWTAFLFLLSGLLFSISLFRYQLVSLLPIAQEAVFAGLSDCVLVLDLNNCIVEMNPSAKNVVNCTGVDGLGRDINQVMPELKPYIEEARDKIDFQREFIYDDGSDRKYYDLHISRLTDTFWNVIGRVVVLHEITQLKQYQGQLEEARDQLERIVSERTVELKNTVTILEQELIQRSLAEKRFEDVIESAPDAMFLLDQSGKILLINAMAERLFGYSRVQLMGLNIMTSLIPEQHRERQQKYFRDLLENPAVSQSSYGVDLYAQRKDGVVFPMEVDLSRLGTSDGFWVAINVRDVSNRKLAEMALRESEQTYRALFENAGDAIFLTDVNCKILQVNQKAAELLGFTQQELQLLSILDLTIPEELDGVRKNMQELQNGKRLGPYIRHYLKKSGEILTTENNTVLVRDVDGKPKFLQNISRDITERIKAEQAREHLMAEIRQSNEQMRDLAFRLQVVEELERQEVAAELHDRVGQNLTGLNLNLKILQNQLQAPQSSEISRRLNDSLIMVEETTHRIRDVMADLDPPVLGEYGLVAAVKWYCGDFSEQTRIITHVNAVTIEPRLAASIEKVLFRLLQETLNNVAKHAQATQVDVGISSDQNLVTLSVRDNGRGFDPVGIKEPTTRPHWGLLSMQQRAASIGAVLSIESSPGTGTCVTVKVRSNHHDN